MITFPKNKENLKIYMFGHRATEGFVSINYTDRQNAILSRNDRRRNDYDGISIAIY